jgi:uncharacterized protein (DUF924 family)
MNVRASTILRFWFGESLAEGGSERSSRQMVWFKKDAAFDAEIRAEILQRYRMRAAWRLRRPGAEPPIESMRSRSSCSAISCRVTSFRDDPRAFARPARARGHARRHHLRRRQAALLLERYVFAMPPPEDRAVQQQGRTFDELADAVGTPVEKLTASAFDYAERHAKIVSASVATPTATRFWVADPRKRSSSS